MKRIKYFVVFVLCICTQVLYEQSHKIKKDISGFEPVIRYSTVVFRTFARRTATSAEGIHPCTPT